MGRSCVFWILERASVTKVIWPLLDTMKDAMLEALLYLVTARGGVGPAPGPELGGGSPATGHPPVPDAVTTLDGIHRGQPDGIPAQSFL